MTPRRAFVLAALSLVGAASLAATGQAQPAAPAYHIESSIPLADGYWDIATYDPEHDRVLVARGAAVSVIGLTKKKAEDIGQVARGHAALAIPGTGAIAVTCRQDDSLRLIDARDGHEIAKVPVGRGPDAALWDPALRQVLVMNAKSRSVSLVDPRSAKVTRTIAVRPALEFGALAGPGLLANNDEDLRELELVDRKQGTRVALIALTGCDGPSGLAADPAVGLTLSACSNGMAALVDVRARKVLQWLTIGQGPDTALFNAKRKRFLVPCGRSGTLSLFSVDGGTVTPARTVTTQIGARTAALDPRTGRVFLPTARFGPAQQGQRPPMLPGSVRLLVLGLG